MTLFHEKAKIFALRHFLDTGCDTNIAGTKCQKNKKTLTIWSRHTLDWIFWSRGITFIAKAPESQSVRQSGGAGESKCSAERRFHFGMGVLHCRWIDFMAINCLFCFKGADVSFTSIWAEKTSARRRLETLSARNYLACLGVCSEKLSARQCLTSKDGAE